MNFASISTRAAAIAVLGILALTAPTTAQQGTRFVGMGDSIGEGVQSADANEVSQPFSFVNFIAWRMGADLPIPLIRTGLFGAVGSTDGRSRVDPTVRTRNLAVSGADVYSILNDRATATAPDQIDSETELVLFPEIGSQIEIAERLRPQYAAVWIGNNDALGAALAFDQLNATQLTPVAEFTANFTQLVDRLAATGTRAAFGTIPDITGIGFLLNRDDLVRFLGSSYGLPEGSVTGVPAMFLVKLGLLPSTVFSDPNYALDPAEQQIISNHIAVLNDVIRSTVLARNMALVETHGIFDYLSDSGLNLFGVNLTTRFLGGLFSLDGVHPSNIGHGLAAFFFIEALNQKYGAGIPQIDGNTLFWLTLTDPFIDKDRDGRVAGRFGLGLLETVFSILGISGDSNDGTLAVPSAGTTTNLSEGATSQTLATPPPTTARQRTHALDAIARQTGVDWRGLSKEERVEAVHKLFGTSRRTR